MNASTPSAPHLIFFCELAAAPLAALFRQPEVVQTLQQRRYGVALAITDHSPARAEVVRLLNTAQVPVVAWLLLPQEHGYWLIFQNYPHALAAYRDLQRWVKAEQLQFAGVGLDIEPALRDVQAARRNTGTALLARLWRARRNALFPAARLAYTDLIANMRHDGYTVYGYQLPLVMDDRRAGSTLVQRMFDILDLPVDEEVLMCYSSLVPRNWLSSDFDGALVHSYGIHADGLAVGSTGGGVVLDLLTGAQAQRLSWEAFERDLRIAARYTPTVHVFSLEGCVEQGWLGRIADVDWATPVVIPRRSRLALSGLRGLFATVLLWSRYGWTIVGWLGWVVLAWLGLRQRVPAWWRRLRHPRRGV